MKFFGVLFVLCGLVFPAAALDREAFTFIKYDLDVRVEPEQQRLGVRGKITLRNDSESAQKNLALQISSTLNWSSIQLDGQPVEFVSQIYNSDIDHTGALTEAIVTLPRPVGPKQTVELEIGYEGIIPQDTTRLTRIGTPADVAKHSDWDQIGKSFTAVRGIGYVTWYPVAAEAASLSEGNSVFEVVGRWKARHEQSNMEVTFEVTSGQDIQFSGTPSMVALVVPETIKNSKYRVFTTGGQNHDVPTFVVAQYSSIRLKDGTNINYFPGRPENGSEYAEALQTLPDIPSRGSHALNVFELLSDNDTPFVSQRMLLTPMTVPITEETELSLVYAVAQHLVDSPRGWIHEGLARYAQLRYLQEKLGRQSVIEYLQNHRAPLIELEEQSPKQGADRADRSLINSSDEFYVQAKAMNVWWMLRDMGKVDPALLLLSYKASDDKDARYMQKLIEAQAHRDLEWFFVDWVYRDRGLPDFRVDSVYPRHLPTGGYMVTITVENLGDAGAEVPVILHMESGEATQKLVVPGKSKAAVRIPAATMPQQVTVNDGSVPESDMSNNIYKVESAPNTQ